jgi:uncharacterized membrane protein YeaQ/YmgE (transglycosylase-associated protein family)
MSILWFLIIGGIVGWLAGVLVRGYGYGVVVDIVIGIVGGVIGGMLAGLIGIQPQTSIGAFVMALIGALILVGIVKAIHKAA